MIKRQPTSACSVRPISIASRRTVRSSFPTLVGSPAGTKAANVGQRLLADHSFSRHLRELMALGQMAFLPSEA